MSGFYEYNLDGVCDVCHKHVKVVVCCGGYGPISNAYCEECYSKGLQPYEVMVAYLSCAGRFPDDISPGYVKDVRRILAEMDIPEEKFIKDIDEAIEELNVYYGQMVENDDGDWEEE